MYNSNTHAKAQRLRRSKSRADRALIADDAPPQVPDLRRRVVIIDYTAHGREVQRVDMYSTTRIDCYRVEINGQPWRDRIGWSRILAAVRKGFPRTLSARALD